jgi:hypothetical protein
VPACCNKAGRIISPPPSAAEERTLMPITIPNYNRKTDRHQFGKPEAMVALTGIEPLERQLDYPQCTTTLSPLR